MLLNPEIAIKKEEKMQEAFELWKALSPEKEEILIAEMSKVVNAQILMNNVEEALEASDYVRIANLFRLIQESWMGKNILIYNLTDIAINSNKLALLYSSAIAAENTPSLSQGVYPKENRYTNAIDWGIKYQFDKDFNKTLQAVNTVPELSKIKIVQLAAHVLFNSNLAVSKDEKFFNWMKLQTATLNSQDRSVTQLDVNPLCARLELCNLMEHPTLLEFQGMASSLAVNAVDANKLEILEFLENNKFEFNKDDLLTAAFNSPNERKPMILWMLLNKYPTGEAITKAVTMKSRKLVNLLLSNGADPNASPNSLILAITNESVEIVHKLLEYNSDCNAQVPISKTVYQPDRTPLTPLGAAIMYYNPEILPLIANNAILDTRPHGFASGQALPFGPFLQAEAVNNPAVFEHFKLLVDKRRHHNIEAKAPYKVETEIELG